MASAVPSRTSEIAPMIQQETVEVVEVQRRKWSDTPTNSDNDLQALANDWQRSAEDTQQRIARPRSPQVPRETQAVAPIVVSQSSFAKAVAPVEASQIETSQTSFAKVNNGVVHIVTRVGGTLFYVEAEVAKLCQTAKVWILETSEPSRSALVAKVGPVYAQVVGGVVRVRGSIGGTVLFLEARASKTWSACASRAMGAYAAAQEGIVCRTQPLVTRSLAVYSSAKAKTVCTIEPYFVRAKDGVLYVRATVGTTAVNIKLGVCEKGDRVKMAALTAYANSCGLVANYTGPVVSRVVAMYEKVSARVLSIVEPYLLKAHNGSAYAHAKIGDMVVAIKVRALTASNGCAELCSSRYVTVKNGFVYVRGIVGTRVLCIKLRLSELADRYQAALVQASVGAMSRIVAVRDQTCSTVLALGARTRDAVSDRSVQITAVSAAGGAAALGTAGGATGLVAGGAVGAAAGVPAALFTFGLSIPVGAAIGSGVGLCAGTIAGGAAGLMGGGCTGHKVHQKRDAIADGVSGAMTKVSVYKGLATETAVGCKSAVADRAFASASYMRERFVGTVVAA